VIKKIGKDCNLPVSGMIREKGLPGVYRVPIEQKKESSKDVGIDDTRVVVMDYLSRNRLT
jgi:hypothetical protein